MGQSTLLASSGLCCCRQGPPLAKPGSELGSFGSSENFYGAPKGLCVGPKGRIHRRQNLVQSEILEALIFFSFIICDCAHLLHILIISYQCLHLIHSYCWQYRSEGKFKHYRSQGGVLQYMSHGKI